MSNNTAERQKGISGETKNHLLKEENILIDVKPAWTAWTTLILVGLLFLFSIIFFYVGIAIFLYVWWQRRKLRYVVTESRIIKIKGGLAKSTNEAWLGDIRGVQTGSTFLERLLGHGRITVSHEILSSGIIFGLGGTQGLTFAGIPEYQSIASDVRQQIDYRKKE